MSKNRCLFGYIFIVLLLVPLLPVSAQDEPSDIEPEKLEEYRQRAEQMVKFLEYSLNVLGDPSASVSDKETIINESYLKFFRDDNVQIEDDLDENRDIPISKDVQAYLKDIDFFFKNVDFEYNLQEVNHYFRADNVLYFKVTVDRHLSGINVYGDSINNIRQRFIEINVNQEAEDLRIVSIYTTKLNEAEELKQWWYALPPAWHEVFGAYVTIRDSVSVQQLRTITSLKAINISNNWKIQNLQPLNRLTELETVDCSNTMVTDLSPLRNLVRLRELDCSGSHVNSLEPLKYTAGIRKLDISSSKITDLAPVKRFTQLEMLNCSNTAVRSLEALQSLANLTTLKISSTKVQSLAPLQNSSNLQVFYCDNTGITDLSPLTRHTKLQRFSCENTGVESLAPLSGLTQLKLLILNNTRVADLSPLQAITGIEKIYCDKSEVTKTEADRFMEQNPDCLVVFESEELQKWWESLSFDWKSAFSETIGFQGTPTKEQLHEIANLDMLDVSNRQRILSLLPVARLTKLRKLNCTQTGVSDLQPVSNLLELQELNCSHTKIKSVAPLSANLQLEVLLIDFTEVIDIEPLFELNKMKRLYCDGTQLTPAAIQQFLQKHPQCLVIFKTVEITQWWYDLSEAWKDVFRNHVNIEAEPTKEQLHKVCLLQSLSIENREDIRAIEPLTQLINLRELYLRDMRISSLSPLKSITTLEVLHFPRNPIEDIGPLSALSNLKELNCENTPVDDLSPLAALKQLERLNCSGTQISHLRDLSEIKSLRELDCSNTSVRALGPLEDLPDLKTIKCYNTKIWDVFLNTFKNKRPNIEIIHY